MFYSNCANLIYLLNEKSFSFNTVVTQQQQIQKQSSTSDDLVLQHQHHPHYHHHHGTTIRINIWSGSPNNSFKSHAECHPVCVSHFENDMQMKATQNDHRHMNPLMVPLLRCWRRQKHLGVQATSATINSSLSAAPEKNTACKITYIAPCGRYLHSIAELQRYLLVYTRSQLSVDMFTFEREVRINRQFVANPASISYTTKDITKGREKRAAISCVNTVDRSIPDPKISYMAQCSSPLLSSLQQGPLDCCDCKNNCEDVEKCACWLRPRDAASQLAASLGHEQVNVK